jgi:hypothetical protein
MQVLWKFTERILSDKNTYITTCYVYLRTSILPRTEREAPSRAPFANRGRLLQDAWAGPADAASARDGAAVGRGQRYDHS